MHERCVFGCSDLKPCGAAATRADDISGGPSDVIVYVWRGPFKIPEEREATKLRCKVQNQGVAGLVQGRLSQRINPSPATTWLT